MTIPQPRWFQRDQVMVSTAPTCGISKSGGLLAKFDSTTGRKVEELDAVTGDNVEVIDDCLLQDMEALRRGASTPTLHFIARSQVSLRMAVPTYYDRRYHAAFAEEMKKPEFAGFSPVTLGTLVSDGRIEIGNGHGSPNKDGRNGEVPYIKVSDLRAGLVNINPTNRVSVGIAEAMWRGKESGLRAYDLLSPERASRNIGDFCVLMPGQEQVLLTKEVIVLRPGPKADFDQFFLLWAMTLKVVRDQWNRIVFMQTNREDVGKRYLEVEIPFAPDAQTAMEKSETFRRYFMGVAQLREELHQYLRVNNHHFFLSGVAQPSEEVGAEIDAPRAAVTD